MPVRSLKDGTITLYDGVGTNVVVDVEEGDLSFTEKFPVNVIRDRGVLSHARKAEGEFTEVSFSMKYQTLSTHLSTTPYDALTRTGGASAWVNDAPAGSAQALKLHFSALDADTSAAENDDIYFTPFWVEEITIDEGDESTVINVSGRGQKKSPLAAWAGVHYELGEATADPRLDSKGNIDLDTLIGSPLLTASGKVGGAIDLDGNMYLEGEGANAVFDNNTKLSVSFWYKTPASAQSQNHVFSIMPSTGAFPLLVSANMTGFNWGFENGAKKVINVTGLSGANSTWSHISVTVDMSLAEASMGKAYVNGSLVTNSPTSSGYPANLGTLTDNTLALGSGISGDTKSKAIIDQVTFFPNYILTAADATYLYNGGAGRSFAAL